MVFISCDYITNYDESRKYIYITVQWTQPPYTLEISFSVYIRFIIFGHRTKKQKQETYRLFP